MLEQLIGKTFYVTRYALSKGILKVSVKRIFQGKSIIVNISDEMYAVVMNPKTDGSTSLDEAISMAERMKQRKIKSLQQQINRLEQLNFTEVHND